MTREQMNEADKAIECLNTARVHIDTAMYYMGEVSDKDPDYLRLRAFYNAICQALDLV